MNHDILWSPWDAPGLEHLHLHQGPDGVAADGLIIGVHEQTPFRARYTIHCTRQWELREVRVGLLDDASADLHLLTDGAGHWMTSGGEALAALQGCLDVDISATPFTNTLPLRRHPLAPGESVTLDMVYIALPQMSMRVTRQRYTCLEVTAAGERYRFESLRDGVSTFTADLPVDREKLVIDYPHLFKRL